MGFFLLEKKIFAIFVFPITPSTYFFSYYPNDFFEPCTTEKKDNIRSAYAISGKTLKTAVINTNTHIYKMK
jgi:hypothetical protein